MSGVLSEEQLQRVWVAQGMKRRIERFYRYLVDRGLLPMSVPRDAFMQHFHDDLLQKFFVYGVKEQPDGTSAQPPDSY